MYKLRGKRNELVVAMKDSFVGRCFSKGTIHKQLVADISEDEITDQTTVLLLFLLIHYKFIRRL